MVQKVNKRESEMSNCRLPMVGTVLLAMLAAIVSVGNTSTANAQVSWKENALQAMRDEKSVFEAIFPDGSNNSFWASMRDDGTRRDGFAEYLCLVLFDSGMPKGSFLVIHIWDAAETSAGVMREIGRSECARN